MSGSATSAPSRAPRALIDRLTSPAGLVLSAAIVALIMPVTSPIRDPDFWWHLRAGQIMLQSHALISTDPFTYTVAGHHWTMHEWLTEVSFAWLHDVGGLGLIVVVIAVITWLGLLAILLRARLDRPNTFVLTTGMVVAAFVGYPVWGPRVQMLTFSLTALTLLIAETHLRRGGRAIWLLVPLFTVWSNFHSGFIVGIALMIVAAGADLAGGVLGWPGSAPPRRARTVILVALVCAGAAMINPNGPGIVLYPFATQGSAAQQAVIQEWHSPDFHQWEILFFYAPMLLSLGLLIVLARSIRARDAALVAATVVLSLQSVRHIALFVAAATPVWINQLDVLVGRRRARRGTRSAALPPRGMRAVTYIILMAVIGMAAASRVATATAVREDSLYYAKVFPVCGTRWLLQAPSGLRIFNQYGDGGYLAYRLSPHGDHVYIFGDAALMGDPLLNTYSHLEDLTWDWDQILTSSRSDLVVFTAGTPLTNLMVHSGRWQLVYHDPRTDIFAPAAVAGGYATAPVAGGPDDACTQLRHLTTAELAE